ncbi:conjugal transfer protein TrbL family protein [Acetobacterium sp.]|uniref:conjugal transfer protein TrbL family protein n=1 Tax=Acetobacterium sp. TaxID=1872094 RepID=UPI002F41A9E9
MFAIFEAFIKELVKNSQMFAESKAGDIQMGALQFLADNVFYLENWIGDGSKMNFFSGVSTILYSLAIWLLILKFTKKGFETHITWTDGDLDADPFAMFTRFVKALILMIAFPVLYNFFARICTGVLAALLNSVTDELEWADGMTNIIETMSSGLVILLIFWIGNIVLYFQLLMRGIEIYIMRIGFPLACIGLLESDNGAFAPYMMTFFQCAVTTVVQLTLMQLAFSLMLTGDTFISLGMLFTGISTPKLLQQFMVPTGGGANLSGKMYSAVRIVDVVRSAVK